jgi:hypothetical protein
MLQALMLALLVVAIGLGPVPARAQIWTDGGRGTAGSTSGSGASERGSRDPSTSPSPTPSSDTPSTPGAPAPGPSTGSPSTPSRRLTNQADCERAGGRWQPAQNTCETGG